MKWSVINCLGGALTSSREPTSPSVHAVVQYVAVVVKTGDWF